MRNFRLLSRLTAAVVLLSPLAAAAQSSSETYRQLNLFGDVFERVRADYVEEVTDEQLIENAINGMLTQLDPHSSYLNAKSYQEMQVQTRGEFGRSEEHTSELQSLMRISYDVFCLKKKKKIPQIQNT